jgi:ABC-type uncharacterized transport system involved in gliding motility auxiliary subunit
MHVDRRTKLHLRAQGIIFHALFAALVVALAYLSTRYVVDLDWTAAKRNSVSDATIELLGRIEGPIAITAYATNQPARRELIAKVVGRYQAAKPDLALAFVDPNTVPDKVRELGLTSDGTLVVEFAGRSEKVAPDFRGGYPESELTNALQRLVRGGDRYLAFLEGHGERRFDGQANHDLSGFGRLLGERGLKLTYLNLATAQRVPDNVAVVVVASPQAELLPLEQKLLAGFVAQGGNLLWFAEQLDGKRGLRGLDGLARQLGLTVLPGVIVDPRAQVLGSPDPRLVIVDSYQPAPFTKDFDLTTVFPLATGIDTVEQDGWTVRPFAQSLGEAWLETGKVEGVIQLDAGRDRAGPITLGVYLARERAALGGGKTGEQRVVVMADGDFLADQFAGNGGNLDLGLNLVSWLAQDDDFININVKATPDATLSLDDRTHLVIAAGFLLVLPLLLVAAGVTIWWRRRRG